MSCELTSDSQFQWVERLNGTWRRELRECDAGWLRCNELAQGVDTTAASVYDTEVVKLVTKFTLRECGARMRRLLR